MNASKWGRTKGRSTYISKAESEKSVQVNFPNLIGFPCFRASVEVDRELPFVPFVSNKAPPSV
jgi:hypothetical protein